MDAEQGRRAEEGAGTIDSIALEALGPMVILPAHPRASIDDTAVGLSPSTTRTEGSSEDFEAASESTAVDGERIDVYCDKRQLDVPARLRLFSQVCEAVHVTHQHAVICRDLKPGKILITSEDVPTLSECGFTKLVRGGSDNDAEADALARLTRNGKPLLAPEYASPEQVMGEAVTTASDIYSLGVILYELLTGRCPYHLKTGTISELLQAICEQVPERPSTSVIRPQDNRTILSSRLPATQPPLAEPSPDSPPLTANTAPYSTTDRIAVARRTSLEGLKRILSGDLEMIILMAMRKEPERRYASADQFADDLKYYLKGLPVRAHPDSMIYRTIKFMRRHVAAAIIGGIFAFAFVAGVVGITAGSIVAHRERDRAEESSRQAREAVDQLVARVSEQRLLNEPGLHPLRKTLLEDAQRFYEHFLRLRSGDRLLQAELASARTHVAQISSVTSSTTEALKQFEQAVALWDNLVATYPARSVYRETLARTLNEQGRLMMLLPGGRDEAFRIFRRARDLIEPLVADSDSAKAEHELAMALQSIAEIERERGRLNEAIENIQRSLAIETKLSAKDPGELDPLITMANGHTLLGQILVAQPEGAEPAITEYQLAIELLEKVNREHPELSEQAFELASFLRELSTIQQMVGKLDSALASVSKAAEILERLGRQYPTVLNYEQGLASTYNMISDLHRHRREPAEAIAFVHKAQTLLERLLGMRLDDAYLRLDLAKSQNTLGRVLQETGEPVAALRAFQHAVDLYESIPELDQRNCYNLACNVALCIPLIGIQNGAAKSVDISKLSKGDQLRRKRYGDRAIDVLRTAVEAEFLDLDILRSDTDLDSIRDRPDFQSLLDEVEKKTAGRDN